MLSALRKITTFFQWESPPGEYQPFVLWQIMWRLNMKIFLEQKQSRWTQYKYWQRLWRQERDLLIKVIDFQHHPVAIVTIYNFCLNKYAFALFELEIILVWLTRYIGDGRREGCITKLKFYPNHFQHLNFIENQQNISYFPYNFSFPVSSDKCWLTKKKQTVLVKPELKVYLKILDFFCFLLPIDLHRHRI